MKILTRLLINGVNTDDEVDISPYTTLSELVTKLKCDSLLWNGIDLSAFTYNATKFVLDEDDLSKPFFEIHEDKYRKPNIKINDDNVLIDDNLCISLHKTVVLPPNSGEHYLPPDLGKFHIEDNGEKLFVGMAKDEALWISFESKNYYSVCAIKVAAGNIDAVSGDLFDDKICTENQNYLSIPNQPWIDGVRVQNKSNLVRQFVLVDEDNKKSIDNQLIKKGTITEQNNTIRIHVHRFISNIYQGSLIYLADKSTDRRQIIKNFTQCPADYGLKSGDVFYFYKNAQKIQNPTISDIGLQDMDQLERIDYGLSDNFIRVYVKTLMGCVYNICINKNKTVDEFKEEIEKCTGLSKYSLRVIFGGKQLHDDKTLLSYGIKHDDTVHVVMSLRGGGGPPERGNLSVACGGLIKQSIYRDMFASSEKCYSRTYDQIVFRMIHDRTEEKMISYKAYNKNNLPWYKLNDDAISVVKPNVGALSDDIKS